MRTLTLGILIVSGGTLAALPFRRYHAIPDASSAPIQVTGPTHSALDMPESDSGVVNALATVESSDTDPLSSKMLAANLPRWPASVAPQAPQTPRRVDIPLSYEDLALPIDQPVAIDQRFNATARVREKQLERERVAALVMPAMESLATSQRAEIQRATMPPQRPSSEAASNSQAVGALASVPRSNAKIEHLGEAPPVERDRHWIRQPD